MGGYPDYLDSFLNTIQQIRSGELVTGLLIGGIADEAWEQLNLCGRQGIICDIEIIKLQHINTAYEFMPRSDVKHRRVINQTSVKDRAPR